MASLCDITVKRELRLCRVNGKVGYFHCWEHYLNGDTCYVRAIVEFPEGMGYTDPKDLKFCDEAHADLCTMDKFEKEDKNES